MQFTLSSSLGLLAPQLNFCYYFTIFYFDIYYIILSSSVPVPLETYKLIIISFWSVICKYMYIYNLYNVRISIEINLFIIVKLHFHHFRFVLFRCEVLSQ